jgi:hypothetical protein
MREPLKHGVPLILAPLFVLFDRRLARLRIPMNLVVLRFLFRGVVQPFKIFRLGQGDIRLKSGGARVGFALHRWKHYRHEPGPTPSLRKRNQAEMPSDFANRFVIISNSLK